MTSEPRSCIDCGGALPPNKTRPALRCTACNRIKRRKQRDPIACVDCAESFDPSSVGRIPERCPDCRLARKRRTTAAKSKRWREANAEKHKAQMRAAHERRKANPEFRAKRNEYEMLRKYGLTMADFEALLEAQGGVCAICGGGRVGPGKRFHIDHCHDSNKVRGLLCSPCNTAIGLLGDDPERAEKAAAYLRR